MDTINEAMEENSVKQTIDYFKGYSENEDNDEEFLNNILKTAKVNQTIEKLSEKGEVNCHTPVCEIKLKTEMNEIFENISAQLKADFNKKFEEMEKCIENLRIEVRNLRHSANLDSEIHRIYCENNRLTIENMIDRDCIKKHKCSAHSY